MSNSPVGKALSRVDGPLKVRGEARFSAEFPIAEMVYAAVAYSTIAKGRIVKIDTAKAERSPGVVLVMTHANAPRIKPMPLFMTQPLAAGPSSLSVMQDDRIHWNGQPIAVILAESQEQADEAAALVRAEYESEDAIVVFDDAKHHAHMPDSVLGEPSAIEIGDAEAELKAAAHHVDITFRTPRHNHNAIEPHAVTLSWNGDALTVHDASQAVRQTAWTLAHVFGVDDANVRVTSPFVGGGFGGKMLWFHHVLAAAAAKMSGRPVRLVLSREGVFRAVGGRTTTEQRVAIGADDDGRFVALIHTGNAATTPYNNCPEQFTFPARHLYAAGTMRLVQRVADVQMIANTFMRAPGESVGTFALECAIDELAERLKLDPIELRMRNEPKSDPTSGRPFSARHLVDAYRAGAKRFGWSARNTKPSSRIEGEWAIGMGCATGTYPYFEMPNGAARITLFAKGDVVAEVAAHEMGMGTATAQAQVVAELFGVPVERVTIEYGDSKLPGAFIAGGSSQTATIGAAIVAAHAKLVRELHALAGNASSDHFVDILKRANRESISVEADAPESENMETWSMHSYSAIFAEVRVNTITGEPRLRRLLGSFDCGRILNPKTAASQFRGGIIMGIGLALMEETQFDERNGRIMNPSLAEYHVPVHADVPEIDVMWTGIPDPNAPTGARGIGEIGITGTGAAIANAVYNACGKRVHDLPITLDKLM